MEARDRRVTRTRAALVGAFNHLILARRRRRGIKVADIVAEAKVGRSTFYDHYSGTDAIFLEAIRHPFGILADALTGSANTIQLTALLEHFWENRQLARETLSRADLKVGRILADMIEARLDSREAALSIPNRLAARQLAEAALAPIGAWVMAEASCSPAALAKAIAASSAAMLAALSPPA
jgi:AcrR family transcriptional regulator